MAFLCAVFARKKKKSQVQPKPVIMGTRPISITYFWAFE